MLLTAILFLASAGAIYLSCEYFVNGIEWLGERLQLAQTATGTVLAALGTALPESAVTFIAVVFGRTASQKDLGVGAAIGGPLVLATIGYAIVGIALLATGHARRGQPALARADQRRLSGEQGWFLAIFVCTIGLGLVSFAFKRWVAVLLVLAYAAYAWRELRRSRGSAPQEHALQPLKLRPQVREPSLAWALIQTAAALIVIMVATRVFVTQLEHIGTALRMAPAVVALLLSPVATELPETLNAVIWVRQGKTRLALANISGSMMIQATIPSALGLYFTSWRFDAPLLAGGIATTAAIVVLWTLFRRGVMTGRSLASVVLLYAAFAVYVVWRFHHALGA